MPTAVPAIYLSVAQRRQQARRRAREGMGATLCFAILPIVVALVATAATHHGGVSRAAIKATLLQAGEAVALAEMPR